MNEACELHAPPSDTALKQRPPMVRLRNLNKRYGEVTALHEINLDIPMGEMLAIVGPSGSGKTTLLNLIGLLDKPSSGHIELLGTALTEIPPAKLARQRCRTIGFVFQSFNLIPVLDALDNVLLPLRIAGRITPEQRQRAIRLLEEVGLAGHTHKRPDKMSGGQRQRVAIARALINEPRLVIADEPTASLDSENAHAALQLFQRLNRSHGVTFVFSTHDERALSYMDRCLNLCDGRLIKQVQPCTH